MRRKITGIVKLCTEDPSLPHFSALITYFRRGQENAWGQSE